MSDASEESKAELIAFVERYERLEDQNAEVARKKSDVIQEAKSLGFARKPFKLLCHIRRVEKREGRPHGDVTTLYLRCLGIFEPMLGKLDPRGASEGWEMPSDLPDA